MCMYVTILVLSPVCIYVCQVYVSPLVLAIKIGNIEVIDLLLKNNAQINPDGVSYF